MSCDKWSAGTVRTCWASIEKWKLSLPSLPKEVVSSPHRGENEVLGDTLTWETPTGKKTGQAIQETSLFPDKSGP